MESAHLFSLVVGVIIFYTGFNLSICKLFYLIEKKNIIFNLLI